MAFARLLSQGRKRDLVCRKSGDSSFVVVLCLLHSGVMSPENFCGSSGGCELNVCVHPTGTVFEDRVSMRVIKVKRQG